jgi:hypothetical protein
MYNECALISILCGLSYLEGQVSAEVEVFCVTATPPNQQMRHASVFSWPRAIVTGGGAEQNNAGITVLMAFTLYPFPGSGRALLFRFNGHDE